jgi:hypothetical protein
VFVFFNRTIGTGWASTILVGTFLRGANLLFLGIIGEYIASTFEEPKGRPIYIVESWRAPSGAEQEDLRAGDVSSQPPGGLAQIKGRAETTWEKIWQPEYSAEAFSTYLSSSARRKTRRGKSIHGVVCMGLSIG